MAKIDKYVQMAILTICAASFLFSPGRLSAAQNKSLKPTSDEVALIQRIEKPFKGDLDQIRKRRIVRVLVNYSKTNFFIDLGKLQGFEYELLKSYEKHLNKTIKDKYARTKMIFVPVPFDKMLSYLDQGRGDIAASGLTVTPARQKLVAFTEPYLPEVNEVVVLNKKIKWDIMLNFGLNRSKVVKVSEDLDTLILADALTHGQIKLIEGQLWGEVYTRGFERDTLGQVIVNPDGTPQATNGQDIPVANYNPDWLGGIRNTFSYNNFDFSFLIDIRKGGSITSRTNAILYGLGLTTATLKGRDSSLVFI